MEINYFHNLRNKIKKNKAVICVMGLGYVGSAILKKIVGKKIPAVPNPGKFNRIRSSGLLSITKPGRKSDSITTMSWLCIHLASNPGGKCMGNVRTPVGR